ncbi:hypothetical protein FNH22_05945 [Fulvivirga sp. M361]|uniref:hypothetical protein n=1 Tax=Fulvivirga sp. M361 TaxID=2594266 RepID=UPI00117ACC27|nr:hypothetical protein [Fulvivirga sp. M361]TRX60591.1 hypothetical protein FNH22_05945 [Fulvivirga sp. M361]
MVGLAQTLSLSQEHTLYHHTIGNNNPNSELNAGHKLGFTTLMVDKIESDNDPGGKVDDHESFVVLRKPVIIDKFEP